MTLTHRLAPLVAIGAVVPLAACLGSSAAKSTTTTTAPAPPHLVAIVTMIGTGSGVGTGDTVEAIDLSTTPMTMRALPVGTFPDAVAISPNNKVAYVASYDANTVTPINLVTGKVEAAIPAGSGPAGVAVAPDGKTVYVTDAGTSPIGTTVTPISTKSGKALAPITVGAGPQGIAITPDGTTAYVADAGAVVTGQPGSIGSTVTPIDLSTKRALAPITVGNGPLGVAIAADGSVAYVTNTNSGSVSPITVASNSAGTPIQTNGSPQAVAMAGSTAWVAVAGAAAGADNLAPINPGAVSTGSAVALGKAPTSVTIAPGGTTAWVVESGASKLASVDLASGKLTGVAIALPAGPYAVALAEVSAKSAHALSTVSKAKTTTTT